jgi:hypothetical protein
MWRRPLAKITINVWKNMTMVGIEGIGMTVTAMWMTGVFMFPRQSSMSRLQLRASVYFFHLSLFIPDTDKGDKCV